MRHIILRDILSMGKIQEFREKVGVSQISIPRKDIWRCLSAEFIGTFLLILIGCGSTLNITGTKAPELLGVALCFGLMVATLATTLSHYGGQHLNPAVTFAMLVTGKIEIVKALLYVVVQCVAGIVAIGVLKLLSPGRSPSLLFGYVTLAPDVTPVMGVGVEFIITFALVFVIFAVSDEHRTDLKGVSGPLAVALALTAVILYGGPLTGAGINPSRVLGPCVILGRFENHWIYWVGPISGGIVAGLIYEYIFRALRPDEVEALEVALERKAREQSQPIKEVTGPEV